MAWTAPRTWVTGELVTASLMNTHIRDNETELRGGGIAMTSQTAGDLVYASSTTQFGRIAAVAVGQVLTSAGTGTVPAYSGTLPAAVQTNITQLGTITTSPLTVSSSNSYIKTLSSATTNDSAYRCSDGSTEWYAGLLGAAVGTGGSYRLYNGGVWFQLSTTGAMTLGATNITHTFGAAGTGAVFAKLNNTSGTLYLGPDSSTGSSFSLGNYAAIVVTDVAAGMSLGAVHASGSLRLYAGGSSERWGVNTAGDFTFGASEHIAFSSGAPSIAGGADFGTGPSITGTDYGFVITIGTTTGSTFGGAINFGHTFSAAPSVTFGLSNAFSTGGVFPVISSIGTTSVTIITSSVAQFPSGGKIHVHVHGF